MNLNINQIATINDPILLTLFRLDSIPTNTQVQYRRRIVRSLYYTHIVEKQKQNQKHIREQI